MIKIALQIVCHYQNQDEAIQRAVKRYCQPKKTRNVKCFSVANALHCEVSFSFNLDNVRLATKDIVLTLHFNIHSQVLFIHNYIMAAAIQSMRCTFSCHTCLCNGFNSTSIGQKTKVSRNSPFLVFISKQTTVLPFFCFFFSNIKFLLRYRYADSYRKLYRVLSMMSFFGLREWKFCNKNIVELTILLKSQSKNHPNNTFAGSTDSNQWQNGIVPAISIKNHSNENNHANAYHLSDTKTMRPSHTFLEFDMQTIDWNEYFFHYIPGIKKYFFKESVNNKCIKHYRR